MKYIFIGIFFLGIANATAIQSINKNVVVTKPDSPAYDDPTYY